MADEFIGFAGADGISELIGSKLVETLLDGELLLDVQPRIKLILIATKNIA